MLNLGKGLKQHFLTAFDGWYRTKRFNYDWNTNQMSLGQIEEKRLRLEYGEIGTHCLSLSLSLLVRFRIEKTWISKIYKSISIDWRSQVVEERERGEESVGDLMASMTTNRWPQWVAMCSGSGHRFSLWFRFRRWHPNPKSRIPVRIECYKFKNPSPSRRPRLQMRPDEEHPLLVRNNVEVVASFHKYLSL